MTNSDRVLSFVQKHPGHTQREISLRLHITPEQQVNTILRNLMKKGLLRRERDGITFTYYAISAAKYSKRHADESIAQRTRAKAPGESSEQQEAEIWLVRRLANKLGLELVKKRVPLDKGGWFEVDGFCESPFVLCQAWAHIGSPKSAQKDKVMADALRLLFAKERLEQIGKLILLFSDSKAAAHFQGRSWMAQCLKKNNISIEIIELPPRLKAKVLEAQKRQYR
jgi:DNA-binding MarR family transcriptional regulator